MVQKKRLTNAEYRVMEAVWATEAMVTVPQMVAALNEKGEDWAYQTVATFLRHLEEKGFLSVTKNGKKLCYFPQISKRQYEKNEAQQFVSERFDGSLKQFLTAFCGNETIGKQDLRELRAWLDELDD